MFYLETGQYRTSYAADRQIFPLRKDRVGIALVLAVAFLAIPFTASNYWLATIIVPFLVYAPAAIGLNMLTGHPSPYRGPGKPPDTATPRGIELDRMVTCGRVHVDDKSAIGDAVTQTRPSP